MTAYYNYGYVLEVSIVCSSEFNTHAASYIIINMKN